MHFRKPPLGTQLDWGNPLNEGTVLALAMNEGHGDHLEDSSMNGNHGTLTNFAFPPTVASGWNPGRTGVGLNFDGTGDYIRRISPNSVGVGENLTIGALVYPEEAGRVQGIINGTHGGSENFVLRYGSGNTAQFLYWNTLGAAQVVTGVATIQLNVWQYWTAVLFGNNVKIYINGILDKEDNKTGTLRQGSYRWVDVGQYAAGSRFRGSIDQPRIMNRAWSAKEVKDYAMNPWQVYLDE